MADVKNFGLIGVGSSLQFGKGSSKLVNNAGTFNFKAANGTTDVALTAAGITSSAGNVTLTTGNLVLSAESGAVSIGGTNMIVKNATTGGVQLAGTTSVALPAGDTAARGTGIAGAFRANTDTPSAATLEYHNGTTWVTVATGGSTGALQTEINNIEATLGTMVNTDGTTNVAAALTNSLFGSATDLTTALQNLATGVQGKDTLDEIFPATGLANVIYAGAGNTWLQAAPGATSGVQAYDAGLAALAAKTSTGIMIQTGADTYGTATITGPASGISVTNGDGVAGNPTLALTNDLAALEGLTGTGFAVRSATDTWVQRSLVAPAAGFTITDADGVAGNPTFALANDLAALEGLTTIGYMVRTGDGTATTRSLAVVTGDLVITGAADGVSTDTTFGLATVTQGATGNFVKVTLDTKGRVTGNTAVVASDITTLVDGTYVNVSGDTMTGNLSFGSSFTATNLVDPTNPQDAATKNYVDNATTGLTWKTAVLNATTANVTLSGEQTIDGVLTSASRILVKNQTDPTENGIYVTAAGAWVRATDANTGAELDSAAVFVQQGTVNADSGWVQTTSPVTIGTSNIVFSQFSGAGAYTGGTGIDITGNVISARLGAGITDLPTGEIGADVAANKAIQLTTLLTGGQLTFVLDEATAGDSGLTQSSSGLKIQAGKVTNAMLTNSSVTTNGDTGSGTLSLGGTLEVKGTSTQGILTSVAGGTFTVTASDASSSQKGVATFNTASFAVAAGDVTIKTAGVSNAQLANSVITFTGTSGSDAVALGESMAIVSADSAITTTMGANSLSIQLNTVDVGHGGTGQTTLGLNQVMLGNGTSAVQTSSALSFTGTTLTIGATTIDGGGTDTTITSTATNGDVVIMPNGTGSLIVGPSGAGLIQSDTGTALTVRGNTTLTLTSGSGSTTMALPSGTGSKVAVSGPTAADYATGLAANDLVNKQYVDTAIASGASAGAVKSFQATVPLNADGTTNIGTAMPAGATVLSVKVRVDVLDSGAQLSVGKSGSTAAYMTTAENDAQATGLYMAECFVTEAGSVQLIGTVASSSAAGSGSCVVIVTYQVAQ
jgi:hypothetical protein